MSHSYGRFTRGNVDREIDFAHAQFVYSHAEIKVPMPKSPNTSKFAGISSLVNLPICAESLTETFTNDITTG